MPTWLAHLESFMACLAKAAITAMTCGLTQNAAQNTYDKHSGNFGWKIMEYKCFHCSCIEY